jgi:hypothetical protein
VKYGRGLTPFDPAKHARFKRLAEYGFAFPPPSYPIDKTEGITAWGMDGNGPDPTLTVNGGNPVGDCGPCAVPAHANMLTAVLAGEELAANTMTSDQVVDLYFQYTGGQDVGVDLGDWLLWLFQQGLIEGFVAVDLAELDNALGLLDVVVVGVNLNPQADAQFSAGQPWDVGPGDEPDPNEGHAILFARADAAGGPFGWISWGATQPSTEAWKAACVVQAFAVVTKPEADAKGFAPQFEALVADLHALGGTTVTPSTPAVALDPASDKPLYTYAGPDPSTIDAAAWPVAPDVTDAGVTLYTFSGDTAGVDTATGASADWVPFTGTPTPVTPSDPPPAPSAPTPLTVGSIANLAATVGTEIAPIDVEVSGGTPPYSITSDTLPAGLSLAGAVISGTPSAVAVTEVTVDVADESSPPQTASIVFEISVAVAPAPPAPPAPHELPGWFHEWWEDVLEWIEHRLHPHTIAASIVNASHAGELDDVKRAVEDVESKSTDA